MRRRRDRKIQTATDSGQDLVSIDSPIERFNREHGLDWVVSELQANGYRLVRRQANRCRFIRPGSESGIAGVVSLQGKRGDWCVYSHHGAADPLSGKLTIPLASSPCSAMAETCRPRCGRLE